MMVDDDGTGMWMDYDNTPLSLRIEDYANYNYIMIWLQWFATGDDDDEIHDLGGINEDLFRWLDL